MKLFALVALLPYLATLTSAAPFVIGLGLPAAPVPAPAVPVSVAPPAISVAPPAVSAAPPVVPKPEAPKLPSLPAIAIPAIKIPALPALPVIALPSVPKVPTAPEAPVLPSLGSGVSKVLTGPTPVGITVVQSLAANAQVLVSAGVQLGQSAIGAALGAQQSLKVSLPVGGAGSTGTISGVVAPITTGTPSLIFERLNSYIAGLRPINTVGAIEELGVIAKNVDVAGKNAITGIKNGLDYQQAIVFTVTLLRNVDHYLTTTLPQALAGDAGVKKAAEQLDALFEAYLIALKGASTGTLSFSDAIYKAGLGTPSSYSTLLKKTLAVIPPLPTVGANL